MGREAQSCPAAPATDQIDTPPSRMLLESQPTDATSTGPDEQLDGRPRQSSRGRRAVDYTEQLFDVQSSQVSGSQSPANRQDIPKLTPAKLAHLKKGDATGIIVEGFEQGILCMRSDGKRDLMWRWTPRAPCTDPGFPLRSGPERDRWIAAHPQRPSLKAGAQMHTTRHSRLAPAASVKTAKSSGVTTKRRKSAPAGHPVSHPAASVDAARQASGNGRKITAGTPTNWLGLVAASNGRQQPQVTGPRRVLQRTRLSRESPGEDVQLQHMQDLASPSTAAVQQGCQSMADAQPPASRMQELASPGTADVQQHSQRMADAQLPAGPMQPALQDQAGLMPHLVPSTHEGPPSPCNLEQPAAMCTDPSAEQSPVGPVLDVTIQPPGETRQQVVEDGMTVLFPKGHVSRSFFKSLRPGKKTGQMLEGFEQVMTGRDRKRGSIACIWVRTPAAWAPEAAAQLRSTKSLRKHLCEHEHLNPVAGTSYASAGKDSTPLAPALDAARKTVDACFAHTTLRESEDISWLAAAAKAGSKGLTC